MSDNEVNIPENEIPKNKFVKAITVLSNKIDKISEEVKEIEMVNGMVGGGN